MRAPFYLKFTQSWYVKDVAGRRIFLSKEKDEAFKLWERMKGVQSAGNWNGTFSDLAAAFLEASAQTMREDRLDRAARFLASFINSLPFETKWREVTKTQVLQWAKEEKPAREGAKRKTEPAPWSASYQRDAIAIVVQVFKWAISEHRITYSPLAGIRVGKSTRRQSTVTRQQHLSLVGHSLKKKRGRKQGRAFALFLIAMWHSGARPETIASVQPGDVMHDGAAWVMRKHKTAGKTNKPLVIHLSPCLQTLTRILVAARKDQPGSELFRNGHNKRWKKDTICMRFRRMRDDLKLPPELTAYSYRHAFATDLLVGGTSLAVVAQLLGHVDTRMVGEVYGHLEKHAGFLQGAVADGIAKRQQSQQPQQRVG